MEIDLSRCQPGTCPAEREGLTCPRDTLHTPWYCHGFRQNPEAWGPKIVEGARKDAARVTPSEFQLAIDAQRNAARISGIHRPFITPPGLPRGVIQVWPLACVGGAERAMISVIKATSPAILWRGVAILATSGNAPEMLTELQTLCPVAIGPEQTRTMIAGARAVVTWAVADIADLLPMSGVKPKVIGVSHSPAGSPWAMSVVTQTKGVDQWVGVSRAATAPIPAGERSRAKIIPNAIDPARLKQRESRESVRASWRIPLDAKILGCYHRQSVEKDPTALARAIANLPDNWYGVSVGSGFEDASVRSHAASVSRDRVIVLPSRTDAGSVLGAFDALLVSSEYESFCLSMAEAFAFGLPVISTPVGIALDHPSLVRSVPIKDDGRTIARAVLTDDADPRATSRRASRAKAVARKLWYPDRLAKSWARLLRDMIDDNGSSDERAASCAYRGCHVGCDHSICNRDHREVRLSDCQTCAAKESPMLIGA